MYANVAVDVPRTRAGRNVNCRAASRAGSSNGGAERITFASATPPPASTCTSTSTIPFSRAGGGYNGIALTRGNGVSSDGDAPSLGSGWNLRRDADARAGGGHDRADHGQVRRGALPGCHTCWSRKP